MAKNNNDDTTNKIRETLNIREVLDEAPLPDHLLKEGSVIKQKRIAVRQYAHMLYEEKKELYVDRMVQDAQRKFREDEEFYNKLLAMEELANYFKHLSRHPNEQEIAMRRMLEQQEEARVRILLENLGITLRAVNEKSLAINKELYHLKDEVNALKASLPTLKQQYYTLLESCINEELRAFQPFKLQTLATYPFALAENEKAQRKWQIEIDETTFKELMQDIFKELSGQKQISLHDIPGVVKNQTNIMVQNKIADSLITSGADYNYTQVLDFLSLPEIIELKKKINAYAIGHIEQAKSYKELQEAGHSYETTNDHIAEKELAIEKLEKKIELLDKCREAIETAALVNQRILETKQASPQLLSEMLKHGTSLVTNVMQTAELSPSTLKLAADPFADDLEIRPGFRP